MGFFDDIFGPEVKAVAYFDENGVKLSSGLHIPMNDIIGYDSSKKINGQDVFILTLTSGISLTLDYSHSGYLDFKIDDNWMDRDWDKDCPDHFRRAFESFGTRTIPPERQMMEDGSNAFSEEQLNQALMICEHDLKLYKKLVNEKGVLDIDASNAVVQFAGFSSVNLINRPELRERAIALLKEWEDTHLNYLLENFPSEDRTRTVADWLTFASFMLAHKRNDISTLSFYQQGVASIIDLCGCDDEKSLAVAQENISTLGDSDMAKERKIIVCSKEKRTVNALLRTKPGLFVCIAEHIDMYNETCDPTKKLVFQPGHPQNGCTYVQHPFRKNVYYEVNSYHDSLRERKQNELLRILESLGAYSARVEVRHEQHEKHDTESEINVSGSGSYGAISGSGSTKQNVGRQSSTSSSQSAAVDWSFNPPDKPCIPDDLVFYPTEEKWQQLAASVLRGGLKRAVVDLEYKSEYGITEKYLSDISASAKSLIPSFEMNINRSFSSNLRRLTSTQWHYEVVFENEAGKRAGGSANTSSSIPTPQISTDTSKAEALFAKRAKRYAQSEGHINAEQRADLEAFAQKYGIDDFRMEELIEEAFV